VINAYGLKASTSTSRTPTSSRNDTVRNRILDALKIVKQNNPSIKTIVTFGTSTTGPTYYGNLLIELRRRQRREHRRVYDHAVRLRSAAPACLLHTVRATRLCATC
jgi:hypothetical protein